MLVQLVFFFCGKVCRILAFGCVTEAIEGVCMGAYGFVMEAYEYIRMHTDDICIIYIYIYMLM